MLKHEIQQAFDIIEIAAKSPVGMRTIMKGSKLRTNENVLTAHRCEQINRILRYVLAHWGELDPKIQRFLYPERFKGGDSDASVL